jgi:hypothetical protein
MPAILARPDSTLTTVVRSVGTRWGIPAVAIAVVVAAIAYFDLLSKGSTYTWRAVSWLYRKVNRRRLQNEVRSRVNEFLDQVVFRRLADAERAELSVEFVQSSNEVRERADGRVIVRMREDRDQDLNVLLALATAVTQVFHPSIRGYLSKTTQSAIDLQIVSELATRISDRARRLFHTHLLEPKLREDHLLGDALHRLHEIADAGLFEAVLLQELQQLSDRHVRRPPLALSADVDAFVLWLYQLAIREVGDESLDLSFVTPNIQAAMLLAAKKATATRGTEPYRRRARRTLFQGVRRLYLLGLARHHGTFVNEIANALVEDGWLIQEKTVNVTRRRDPTAGSLRLVMFRRDEVRFSGKSFADFAKADGVHVGATVVGAVRDLNSEVAYIRIGDVDAELPRRELAWGFRGNCEWLLTPGGAVTILVTDVFEDRCFARVSIKQTVASPWRQTWMPKRDDKVKGEVVGIDDTGTVHVRLRFSNADAPPVYAVVPSGEWSWYREGDADYRAPSIGQSHAFRVVLASEASDDIHLSRATLEAREWETIERRYPKGTRCRARVIRVDYDGVRCELEPGVFGRIDRPELVSAGFEYADYQHTVVPGQSIDVVVIGRRQRRQFLKLDLQRNIGS